MIYKVILENSCAVAEITDTQVKFLARSDELYWPDYAYYFDTVRGRIFAKYSSYTEDALIGYELIELTDDEKVQYL